jgi:hypothetical protein
MSDPIVDPVVEPAPAVVPKADEPLEAPGLKALAAERKRADEAEARVKAFESAQDEAEKAKLSDIERANTEAAEARAEAVAAKAEALRLRVAAKHGISDEEDMELFLTGRDEATLTRQAEKLAARSATPGIPKPDPSSGPKEPKDLTVSEQAVAAEKAGDKAAAGRLKALQLGALANSN